MGKLLSIWLVVLIIGFLSVRGCTRIAVVPEPTKSAQDWAMRTLEAWRTDGPPPLVPADARHYQSPGPVIVSAWHQGKVRARFRAQNFVEAVQGAVQRFARRPDLARLKVGENPLRFTITVVLGYGPLVRFIPMVSSLGVVPVVEGVEAEINGNRFYVTPEDMVAGGYCEKAVRTPLPDLSFGVDLETLVVHLAANLQVPQTELVSHGRIRRFRAVTIRETDYPAEVGIGIEELKTAARDGARFLLRHQKRPGVYTYLYDGQKNQPVPRSGYNLARHAGTTYFLAQVDRSLGMPQARDGAIRALSWIKRRRLANCGGKERLCVAHRGRMSMGATALTALAAAEILQNGDILWVRQMLKGLTAFIRSMQRADGELMHDYDFRAKRPIDIQRMYYSGEAAFALVGAHSVLGDRRDLDTVERLMTHLTGAGWNFFGSRYYYGEEHWTCQAAAAAAAHFDVREAYDFCNRWAAFNRRIQYADTSPWPIDGGYGVGPLFSPRITPVASRTEALISIYEMAERYGDDTRLLKDQIERGLKFMMRYRWAPGPAHLLFDPRTAFGGMPGSPIGLRVRNDYVQHAGAAMLLWAEKMR